MTSMVGSMVTGGHVAVATAKSLHPNWRYEMGLLGDQEEKGEIVGLL